MSEDGGAGLRAGLASPSRTLEIVIVPHTHWDREWYLPFEQFRIRLVRLVDRLLELFAADPAYSHFMLDGQTIVLEDYLAVRPENAGRLGELVKAGKLAIGPWYVLPDEFLVSGEALIRNLQIGMAVAREFGDPMPVCYLPDSFGHLAQIPQIAAGFGFQSACLWRGVDDAVPGTEWHWEALDGTRVYVQWLAGGYGNFAALPADPAKAIARLRREVDRLSERSRSDVRLLLNGSDHLWPQDILPGLLAAFREACPDMGIRQGSLPEAVAAARAAAGDLPVVRGELRSSAETSLLPGVLSARTYLKQANAAAQTLLERWVEPFSALAAATRGLAYPAPFLRQAWKALLANHPHDSICGCSVDPVNRQMVARFEQASQIGMQLRDEAFRALQGEHPYLDGGARHDAVYVYNPHPWRNLAAFAGEFVLDLPYPEGFDFVPATGGPTAVPADIAALRLQGPVPDIALLDRDGASVPCEVEVLARTVRAVNRDGDWSYNVPAARLRVRGIAELPALGWRAFQVAVRNGPPEPAPDLGAGDDWIENAYFRVRAVPGGVELLDKTLGEAAVHFLEDGGDRGDEYNFCPVAGEASWTSTDMAPGAPVPPARAEHDHWSLPGARRWGKVAAHAGPACARLNLQAEWPLPAGLAGDRRARAGLAELGVRLDVTLHAGLAEVAFRLSVCNRSRDHRLRAGFRLAGEVAQTQADTAFGWVARPVAIPPRDWAEPPTGTFPLVSHVAVSRPAGRAAIATRGLHEYEAVGESLYLTLLRCVGWLSRDDLASRLGDAGPMLETPEAQCLGEHEFHYAWVSQGSAEPAGSAARRAAAFAVPASLVPAASFPEEAERSYVELSAPTWQLSALKRAEAGDALVLRVYSASPEPSGGEVRLGFPVDRVQAARLDETPIGPVAVEGGAFRATLRGFEIGTFLIDPAR
ncbi:MAG: hypothetical protein FJZ01_19340 [Candidatus Sericytochromatia bacterium]|nr:hypothetical protein [Candidatus Tanganyikabacteria bacterium]